MRSAGTVPKLYPHLARLIALSMLLVAACLWFAVLAQCTLPPALAQQASQEPGIGSPAPMPRQEELAALLQDTPEEPTGEPQPSPGETAEPAPSETPEPQPRPPSRHPVNPRSRGRQPSSRRKRHNL
jgi:hypothetical protein